MVLWFILWDLPVSQLAPFVITVDRVHMRGWFDRHVAENSTASVNSTGPRISQLRFYCENGFLVARRLHE
jgi:hypothetical protein